MSYVISTREGPILTLTLDRPEALNALNAQVLDDLDGALDAVDLGTVRCLIITGAGGKAFAAGADIAAMAKADLSVDDFDLIEANEAFAAQSVAVARELKFDPGKLNVNGGAIALGHPVGASGCRILVTLLHEMQKRDAKRGLATLCIGGGMGCATIVERD